MHKASSWEVTLHRDGGIDFVKGLCISLVVFAHLPRIGTCAVFEESLVKWIYAFHVPIFVVISGWLFGKKAYVGKDGFLKVVSRLVRPYFTSGMLLLVGYGILDAFGIKSSANPITDTGWSHAVLRVFTGSGLAATWFLGALIALQLLMIATQSIGGVSICVRRKTCGVWLTFISVLLMSYASTKVPYGPRCPTWFAMYFLIGWFGSKVADDLPRTPMALLLVGMTFFMPIEKPSVGNVVLVMSMLAFVLWVGDALLKHGRIIGDPVVFAGRNSLPILMFHPLFNVAYHPVQKMFLHVDPSGWCGMLLVTMMTVMSCILVDVVIRRTKLKPLFYAGEQIKPHK